MSSSVLRYLMVAVFAFGAVSCGSQNESSQPAAAVDSSAASAVSIADTYPQYADQAVKIDKSVIRYDDGDTFTVGDVTIRILGIDTPETKHEPHGIFENQPYGPEASAYSEKILRASKVIEYLPAGKDIYGRVLAHVFIDGKLYATEIIRAGLAYESVSYYGDNGFPDLAQECLTAAEQSDRPPFEEPWLWRKEHQVKQQN